MHCIRLRNVSNDLLNGNESRVFPIMQCSKDSVSLFLFFNFPEIPMNQLVYSHKLSATQPMGISQLLKEAFKSSALGLFIAAVRNDR